LIKQAKEKALKVPFNEKDLLENGVNREAFILEENGKQAIFKIINIAERSNYYLFCASPAIHII
jgi:hypothetical protein